MIVLGIDPGSHRVGYSIIDTTSNPTLRMCGLLDLNETATQNLKTIFHEITRIIREHKPTLCVVEQVFFHKNKKTFASVSHGRGVILLAASLRKIPIIELSPLQVKQAMTGSGTADKKAVARMAAAILDVESFPGPDDVSDAVAIALAGSQMAKSGHFKLSP